MSHRIRYPTALLVVTLVTASCATVPHTPPIHRPAGRGVVRIADLDLPRGADCIVKLAGGETIRGKVRGISSDRLVLDDVEGTSIERSIDHDEIVLIARVVKMSKATRVRLGAAIGALLSLPLGISMVGDMVIPAALVGALVGRTTGDSRAEVVFERLPPL